MKDMIIQAVKHKGMAFINVQQPCPTYNNINTKGWYEKRVYKLEETSWDPIVKSPDQELDKTTNALEKSKEWDNKLPLGVFYKNELIPTYEERISTRIPFYRETPPARQEISNTAGKPTVVVEKWFKELKV